MTGEGQVKFRARRTSETERPSCFPIGRLPSAAMQESFSPGYSVMFNYRDVDEGEEIEDRLMVPLDALELAVQGGWKIADFVSDLKGENGAQAKEISISPGAASC
jgi:hypothetical protein